MLIVTLECYAECHCDKCHYTESHYAECHYAECHYAECHYAEWHYAESVMVPNMRLFRLSFISISSI
jgi:hypothetical protein